MAPAVLVDDTDAAVADCALRLVRLLDRAEAIPLLHPLIARELHCWLLAGRHGRAVRGLACPGGTAQRIAHAVALLRGEFGVGDSYDNALAGTVIGLSKAGVIRRRGPWRSLEAVGFATLDWVDWFNTRRLLEPIGDVPPAEAEECYHAQAEEPAPAA